MIEFTKNYIDKPRFDFRDSIFDSVELIMKQDSNVLILTNDLGAMGIDNIAKFASNRIINVGITEQNMVSVAAGLALSGKVVFVYGILSHIVFRAFEQIKLDVCVQNLPIIFIGVGAGLAYGVDGPTHQGIVDIALLRALPNMHIYNPSDTFASSYAIKTSYLLKMPSFVRVDKENLPQLYSSEESLNLGLIPHGVRINGSGLIFTTGIAVWPCLKAMESLKSKDIESNVIDIFRIKPLNKPLLISLTKNVSWVLCVEECLNLSSLSEVLAKEIINTSNVKLFKSINLGENFLLGSAKREWAWKKFNLNADAITNYVTNNIIGNINE